ncbi:MAG: LysM peptidoglycan-binding domain-containing protein [Alphaproteobacteria bacterium]|nr:LysM peptidoglycan-binding domain-containing protein [Alphaproteobacteria bacterium]
MLETVRDRVGAAAAQLGNAAAQAALESEGQQTTYTVRSGDSLSRIAAQHGTTVDAIVQANGLANPNQIAVGQELIIPAGQATQGGSQQGTTVQQAADIEINEQALTTVANAVVALVPAGYATAGAENVPRILRHCAQRNLTNADQVAYVVATAEHESGFGTTRYSRSESLVEDTNPLRQTEDGQWTARNHLTGRTITAASKEALIEAYWDDCYGGRLGNVRGTSDAADFRGRGFVQLTGQVNYRDMTQRLNAQGFSYTHDGVTYGGEGNPAIDLEANPTHVNLVPDLAARILVTGMHDGSFTGRAMEDYITEQSADFTNARRVVNGDVEENGASIAAIAQRYQGGLAGWSAVFNPSDGLAQTP